MENNTEILSIFPIPIYLTHLPSYLSKVIPYLDSQEMISSDNSSEFGSRSKNSYILNSSECLELSNSILNHAFNYGYESLNYSYQNYKFTQSWISQKHPNESHTSHIHTNSLISGVFYYGNWDNSLPNINFTNDLLIRHPHQPKYRKENTTPFSSIGANIEVGPGRLILFPSTLFHSVSKNNSNLIRKSLAFNIVPTEGFGNESELTELKFN